MTETMARSSLIGLAAALAAGSSAAAQGYYSAGDGLRFGVFAHYNIANLEIADETALTSTTESLNSFRVGASFGYDWRWDRTVFGIEADGTAGNGQNSTGTNTFANDYYATFRARLGYYVHPGVLAYATGGLALAGVEFKTTAAAASSPEKEFQTLLGGVVGAGVEYDWYGMRVFGEYLFSAYEPWETTTLGAGQGNRLSIDETAHQVRLGIKLNLNPEYDVRPYR
jgi:opacity protein-like surface antigen